MHAGSIPDSSSGSSRLWTQTSVVSLAASFSLFIRGSRGGGCRPGGSSLTASAPPLRERVARDARGPAG